MVFDLRIRDTVHSWASPVVTGVLLAITMLGVEWVLLLLGAVTVWRLIGVHRGRRAFVLAVGTLSAELASELLKLAFHRPRPAIFFGLIPAATYSFPSGHAFVATVFYGLLAGILNELYPRERVPIAAATLLLVLLIGLSRVYLGYHYPSDILGGWLCAVAWLAMARFRWPALRRSAC